MGFNTNNIPWISLDESGLVFDKAGAGEVTLNRILCSQRERLSLQPRSEPLSITSDGESVTYFGDVVDQLGFRGRLQRTSSILVRRHRRGLRKLAVPNNEGTLSMVVRGLWRGHRAELSGNRQQRGSSADAHSKELHDRRPLTLSNHQLLKSRLRIQLAREPHIPRARHHDLRRRANDDSREEMPAHRHSMRIGNAHVQMTAFDGKSSHERNDFKIFVDLQGILPGQPDEEPRA